MVNLQEITIAQLEHLEAIADCHKRAFPHSTSTKLGLNYLIKMYKWYFEESNRFLFMIGSPSACLGFYGGIVNQKSSTMGSSSSLLQYTMGEAVRSILLNPGIIFQLQLQKKMPFVISNLIKKIRSQLFSKKAIHSVIYPKPYIGLVVIGVHPTYQGQGLGTKLLINLEDQAKTRGVFQLQLSVKKNNHQALKSYTKNGWSVKNQLDDLLILHKALSP